MYGLVGDVKTHFSDRIVYPFQGNGPILAKDADYSIFDCSGFLDVGDCYAYWYSNHLLKYSKVSFLNCSAICGFLIIKTLIFDVSSVKVWYILVKTALPIFFK